MNIKEELPLAFGVERTKRKYRLRLARYMGLVEAIETWISEQPPESAPFDLLDIGPGSGRSMRFIDGHGSIDKINFHGIDINPNRLETLYKNEEWKLTRGDVSDGLPFPDAQFDIVVCEQVLEHLPNPEFTLREIARVMRPGGLAILGVPVCLPGAAWLLSRLKQHLVPHLKHYTRAARGTHLRMFSQLSFVRLVKNTPDLEVVDTRGFRFFSGGIQGPFEDYRWFWRFNAFLGRLVPWLCMEIQVICRKRDN